MSNSESILKDISPENYFYLSNGSVIRSIPELRNSLQNMDDSVFNSHVNDQKNDFYEWIKHVFGDEDLANQILAARAKGKMQKKIAERLENEQLPSIFIPDVPLINQEIKQEKKQTEIDIPLEKIEEILRKEKEIEKREEKIEEIEMQIEAKLGDIKKPNNNRFFTKEFLQGVLVGILLTTLAVLVYFRFFI